MRKGNASAVYAEWKAATPEGTVPSYQEYLRDVQVARATRAAEEKRKRAEVQASWRPPKEPRKKSRRRTTEASRRKQRRG